MITPIELQRGILVGSNDRVEELNSRILNRTNIQGGDLKPNFDPRPLQTKYSMFSKTNKEPVFSKEIKPNRIYLDYYPEVIFYPGNSKAPISGFFNSVDIETDLRNQNVPLHKADLNIKYIPTLDSDLYNVKVPQGQNVTQPYPLLFEQYTFDQSLHPNVQSNIGNQQFYNHTRNQLRNM